MFQQTYYVDKVSGTSADTLLAVGFAELLRHILPTSEREAKLYPVLKDCGAYFRIDLGQTLSEAMVDEQQAFALLQPLSTGKKPMANGFDYDRQREIEAALREKIKELPSKHRSPHAWLTNDPVLNDLLTQIERPARDLPIYKTINAMKTAPTFNSMIELWNEQATPHLHNHIRLLLALFATHPNPYADIETQAKEAAKNHRSNYDITLVQVTNPTTGKGANRTKGNKLDVGNLSGWWLLELLKFQGFFLLAHPQTIQGTKDRKNYLVYPIDMPLPVIQSIVQDFRSVLWASTPAKMDVLAVLRLLQVILYYEHEALKTVDQDHMFADRAPSERIGGLHLSFYKDMGSAVAVMNVTELHLPDWLPQLNTLEIVQQFQSIVQEHVDVIESIKASDGSERTEEYELLRRYRDFISGRSVEPFLDFCALFAPYLSQKIERGIYHRRFTVAMLNQLFKEFTDMSTRKKLAPIIENPGFQNIATAIRQSTVSLQYAKGRNEQIPFEIRYGLTQDLVRQSNNSLEFMEILGRFVASYNAETARKYEVSKGTTRSRSRVHQDDLNEITTLLDEYPARLIARMLVAYGTAKSGSKEDKDETPNPANPSDNEGTSSVDNDK